MGQSPGEPSTPEPHLGPPLFTLWVLQGRGYSLP